jgi:hypothetical protein
MSYKLIYEVQEVVDLYTCNMIHTAADLDASIYAVPTLLVDQNTSDRATIPEHIVSYHMVPHLLLVNTLQQSNLTSSYAPTQTAINAIVQT